MTSWSLRPAEIAGVLDEVQLRQSDLGAAAGGTATAYESFLSGAGGLLSASAGDLGTALEEQSSMMRSAMARITACCVGAATSTAAYVAGDEQMASDTLALAVSCAESGNLTPLGIAP